MIYRSKYLLTGISWLSLSLSALSLALLPSHAAAAPLYSNGGLNPRATSKSGVAAAAGTFWSELQNNTGNTTEANNIIGSGGAAGTSRLADDFIVPVGATWTINSIDFYGYLPGAAASPSPFTECNVQIWRGRPGDVGSTVVAGDLTTNRLAASIDTKVFRISSSTVPAPGTVPGTTRRIWRNHAVFSTPVVLTAGTYWVEWQTRVTGGVAHFYPGVTVEGVRGLTSWNSRQFSVAGGFWGDNIDNGNPDAAPDSLIDFPFDINLIVCGDGYKEGTEACDDGNTVNGDGCDNNCTVTACGNGITTGTEVCDDGNAVSGDGCDVNCTPTGCGNGVVTGAEVCDDGNKTNGDGCDNNCIRTGCGNGVVTTGETCDDGNTVSGDGCDNNCTPTGCGNNVLTVGEGCDDGNKTNGDGCDNNCVTTGCGNNITTDPEKCDDGNTVSGDGCDNNCTPTACGNGAISAGEECDDGNSGDGDGCDSNCRITACGNGIKTGDEQCDDGNTLAGDGCSPLCTLEELTGGGFSCQYIRGRTELGAGALWLMLAVLGSIYLRRRQRRTA